MNPTEQVLLYDVWHYAGYPLDTPPAACGLFAEFAAFWRAKFAPDGTPPAWGDFNPEDLMKWWGCLSLLRYQYEPLDLYCDLWGTAITEWFNEDYTGTLLSQSGTEFNYSWEQEKPYFERLSDGGLIGVTGGGLTFRDRYSRSVWGLDLPVRNAQGTVSLLTLYVEQPREHVLTLDADPVFTFSIDH